MYGKKILLLQFFYHISKNYWISEYATKTQYEENFRFFFLAWPDVGLMWSDRFQVKNILLWYELWRIDSVKRSFCLLSVRLQIYPSKTDRPIKNVNFFYPSMHLNAPLLVFRNYFFFRSFQIWRSFAKWRLGSSGSIWEKKRE